MKRCVTASMVMLAGLMATGRAAAGKSGDLLAQVDHLVYATPDLNAGIDTLERLLGVRATAGGQHPGLGTRNALIALGPSSYIEIIGPDPDQAKSKEPRRFGIDDLKVPTLVTWVAKGSLLERFAADARLHGVDLGEVQSGSRKRPDGVVLSWRYTDPRVVVANRIVPYFIDWGTSPRSRRRRAPRCSACARNIPTSGEFRTCSIGWDSNSHYNADRRPRSLRPSAVPKAAWNCETDPSAPAAATSPGS